ncbi:MAG: RidA family protein [Bauldia sp.]|nr:RidA family protein [Bauldia sp.]
MSQPKLKAVNPAGAPPAPYSQAIEASGVGRFLFISGQVGVGPDGQVRAGVGEQAAHAVANVNALLAEAGMTTGNIVKLTIYLTDGAHLPEFMAAAGGTLGEPPPATTLLVVKGLADPSLLVEIEAIAVA